MENKNPIKDRLIHSQFTNFICHSDLFLKLVYPSPQELSIFWKMQCLKDVFSFLLEILSKLYVKAHPAVRNLGSAPTGVYVCVLGGGCRKWGGEDGSTASYWLPNFTNI